jgi:tetratricopeptide (TPR) repeat protein
VKGTPVAPTQTSGKASTAAGTKPVKPNIAETGTGVQQGKPNLLYFYWPNPEDAAGQACKDLDTKLWIDGKVATLAQDFVTIRVNGKTCPKVVLNTFGVSKYPTIVLQASNEKIVSRVTSKCVSAKVFAKSMQAVLKTNSKIVKTLELQDAKLTATLTKAQKLLEKGNLNGAEKAFRALIKKYPNSGQASVALSGISELSCRRNLADGQKLLKAKKYYEARSKLQMASECDIACTARDTARELLPDCQYGIQFDEACKLLDAGKAAQAMEAFTKIASDDCYDGQYKALAKSKLQEMKDAWNKRG